MLSGLTHLSLRCVHRAHGTLAAVLPRLTTLRSLVVNDGRPDAPGGWVLPLLPNELTAARRCKIFPPRIARGDDAEHLADG